MLRPENINIRPTAWFVLSDKLDIKPLVVTPHPLMKKPHKLKCLSKKMYMIKTEELCNFKVL